MKLTEVDHEGRRWLIEIWTEIDGWEITNNVDVIKCELPIKEIEATITVGE